MAKSSLQNLRVAQPCHASWNSMQGDERVRFCGECKLNVYNISSMSADEAEALIASHEGRLCVRYYQRRDGKIITRNCPPALAAMRERLEYAVGLAIAAIFGIFSTAMATTRNQPENNLTLVDRTRTWPFVGPVVDHLCPRQTMGEAPVMGTVMPPATTVKPGP